MVYREVSSKAIIAKIFRDVKPPDANWVTDAIEWIGEALDEIGAGAQLIDKETSPGFGYPEYLKIVNHKGILPCDLYTITQVTHNNRPIYPKTSSYSTQKYDYDNYGNIILTTDKNASLKEFYDIKGNYIVTGFSDSAVNILYKGFSVDEDGFPMVPDMIEFKRALTWYVRMMLVSSGYEDKVFTYEKLEERFWQSCANARNQANQLDVGNAENFLNQWVRMIPSLDRFASTFNDLGNRERLVSNFNNYLYW